MKKPKIVFLLGTLGFGGTERQFLETLRRIDLARFEVRVLSLPCSGTLREEIELLGIPFSCLGISLSQGRFHPQSYLHLFQLFRTLIDYLRQEKPDILQSYLFWTNIYGSIAAKIAGVPIIITGRRETLEKKYQRFPNLWLQNLSNRWATVIIANSQLVKKECLSLEKHVTSEKIKVIYNGIDTDQYQSPSNSLEKKTALHIDENAQVVGIVARLHPRKGHRCFLAAAAQILQSHPRTIFLIVGRDQGIQQELEAFAEESGIRNSLIFTGERSDVPDLLSIMDVQVCASSVEGLSNAILEGMASGKPIVATDIAGNPELIIHQQTGLLVPCNAPNRIAKAVVRLLDDRELRTKLGHAARQKVLRNFRMEQMLFQTETLYQNFIEKKKHS